MKVRLPAPAGFSFERTVRSHGWSVLPPFEGSADSRALTTVVDTGEDVARRITLRPEGPEAVLLESPGRVPAAVSRRLTEAANRILALELDLEPFYRVTDGTEDFAWVRGAGFGRLMRGATAFEDTVKLVLTTNCSWALTTKMTHTLVDRYGVAAPDGGRAFPRPERLARVTEKTYRERLRVGYRAPFLRELGRRFARGEVDPAGWPARAAEDAPALRKELLGLPGVGPYVADNLLRLLGFPAGLGLDSWLRGHQSRVYHGGRPVKDRTIERRYARFGRWAGLALWCDATRDWTLDRPSEDVST